jgi:hypothetical protein
MKRFNALRVVMDPDLGREADFPGRTLVRFWNSGDAAVSPTPEPLDMETGKPPLLVNQGSEPAAKGPMKALVAGGIHYIRSGDGLEELYSLEADPGERINVACVPDARVAVQGLRDGLRSMLGNHEPRG